MFSKNKAMPGNYSVGSTTLISKGTTIKGDIHFSGNLEIEGEVCGNIYSKDMDSSVRLMSLGKVIGEIHVSQVVINGAIKGDIYSAKQVQLAAKAVVKGNIHYNVIEIEKGAQVDGSFESISEKGANQPSEAAEQNNVDIDEFELAGAPSDKQD